MNQVTIYQQTWAAQANEIVQHERPTGGAFFSTRAGQLSLGEDMMPGNQIAVVILDFLRLNTYYGERFDPDNPQPPVCYAFGRTEEEMAPHPTMQADLTWFKPQAMECHGCALNEWGSSPLGKGKACQNRRQLAMIPAGYYSSKRGSRDFDLHLFDDEAHFRTADVAFMRLPVTSVNNWAKYVNQVAGNFQRPPAGVVTRIFIEPDAKTQYKVCFDVIEKIPDNLAAAIIARCALQVAAPVQGFQPPREEERQPVRQSVRGSLRR